MRKVSVDYGPFTITTFSTVHSFASAKQNFDQIIIYLLTTHRVLYDKTAQSLEESTLTTTVQTFLMWRAIVCRDARIVSRVMKTPGILVQNTVVKVVKCGTSSSLDYSYVKESIVWEVRFAT